MLLLLLYCMRRDAASSVRRRSYRRQASAVAGRRNIKSAATSRDIAAAAMYESLHNSSGRVVDKKVTQFQVSSPSSVFGVISECGRPEHRPQRDHSYYCGNRSAPCPYRKDSSPRFSHHHCCWCCLPSGPSRGGNGTCSLGGEMTARGDRVLQEVRGREWWKIEPT